MLHPSLRIYSILMIFCLTYNFCFSSLYPAYSFGIALFCKDTLSLLNHIYRNYIHLVLCYTMNSSIYSIVLMSSYIQILELYSLENNLMCFHLYTYNFLQKPYYHISNMPVTQISIALHLFLEPKSIINFFLNFSSLYIKEVLYHLNITYHLLQLCTLMSTPFSIRFIIHYYFKTYNKRGTFHNGPLLFKP